MNTQLLYLTLVRAQTQNDKPQAVAMRLSFATVTSIIAASKVRLGGASVNVSSAFISSGGSLARGSTTSTSAANFSTTAMTSDMLFDPKYPGTALQRLTNVHKRVKELADNPSDLTGRWEDIRRQLLWAGGLRDLPDAVPGQGYTGHSFNDFNHVDLTCMTDGTSDNENDGSVKGIAIGNRLGQGIRIASLPELGPGGSWSTCAMGCNRDPPQDVAHIQFQSKIAFKLVWVPNEFYDSFVLVDDDGKLLAHGKPSSLEGLPPLRERQMNYKLVEGSKYATVANRLASSSVAAE